ncbi:heme-binding protein [Streptomyces olivaceoviridis]|uniref:heme-binding protein n=1 Tax=Streptomyces TaxID=1883 RepID=UPI001FC97F50|nr:heme-binding protein [Streptomyces corchorusii]
MPFTRGDDAWLGSVDLTKAKTSVLFRMPRAALGESSQPGGLVYGIEYGNNGLISSVADCRTWTLTAARAEVLASSAAPPTMTRTWPKPLPRGTGPPASQGSTGDCSGRATCSDRPTVRRSQRPPVV